MIASNFMVFSTFSNMFCQFAKKENNNNGYMNKIQTTKNISETTLKMLGLYFDTLIIGHKVGNMLSILNEKTLQKDGKIS